MLKKSPTLLVVILLLGLILACGSGSPPQTIVAASETFPYFVKVQAKDTGEYIRRAKITIEVADKAPLDGVTDSTGLARISIEASYAGQPGKIIVEATGYEEYTQHIDLTKGDLPDVIQLESVPPTPTSTPSPTETSIPSTPPPTEITPPPTETPVPTSEPTNAVEPTLTTQVPFTTVVINPAAAPHKLNGVGVHIFDSDYDSPNFVNTLDTLGLKYLSVPFGPDWNNLSNEPPACNDENLEEDYELMYNFIEQNFNGDFPNRLENAQAISAIAESRGAEIIFVNWRAHTKWITNDEYKELEESYIDDYVCFVVAVVEFLTSNEVEISYLAPTNEPSDTTDTKIPPERYNTFVINLRNYLDRRGLSNVKILGPGLAYLNHDDTGKAWVQALDGDGVDAISVWASHAWDPKFFTEEPEEDILRMKWEEFQKAVKERERPDQPKPIFITEYACVNDPGNGICAVENTLTLLDQGANAVIYWYLREQDWDAEQANRERALLTGNYEEKSTFTALISLLPFISGDDVWILETQIEGNNRIKPASFKTTDEVGEEQIVAALINSSAKAENILIDLNEFDITGVKGGTVYNGNTNTVSSNLEFIQCQVERCQVSLQPNTITTLVLGFR